mmetsp:Transcript_16839/g.45370  ORF Transcript_16839/g.45370 Transcript_16839/m.45370 type:complete len:284 (-) Transcript_16839:250-1101(-)
MRRDRAVALVAGLLGDGAGWLAFLRAGRLTLGGEGIAKLGTLGSSGTEIWGRLALGTAGAARLGTLGMSGTLKPRAAPAFSAAVGGGGGGGARGGGGLEARGLPTSASSSWILASTEDWIASVEALRASRAFLEACPGAFTAASAAELTDAAKADAARPGAEVMDSAVSAAFCAAASAAALALACAAPATREGKMAIADTASRALSVAEAPRREGICFTSSAALAAAAFASSAFCRGQARTAAARRERSDLTPSTVPCTARVIELPTLAAALEMAPVIALPTF